MKGKHPALWQLSVRTCVEAEEAVADAVSSELRVTPTSYTDMKGHVSVSAYLSQRPAAWSTLAQCLRARLRSLRAAGLAGRVSLTRLRSQDWAESWKNHFKPIEIGRTLLIKPSWSQRRPKAGQAVLVLDPGLSFGTGQHATTEFCLEQLVLLRTPDSSQSFLDLGTGSGILAIAAAKLGYSPVVALDADAQAVQIAKRNALLNGVRGRIQFQHRDAARLGLRTGKLYSLICANLTTDVILGAVAGMANRLESDGALALAGILRDEFARVQEACQAKGLRLAAARVKNGWKSGVFLNDFFRVRSYS